MGRLVGVRSALVRSWWGRILADHDTEPTELGGALFALGLGLHLLGPWPTFAGSPIYAVLAVWPEPAWGVLLALLGTADLLALRDGDRRRRRTLALCGFLIWFTFALSFLAGDPTNTGGVVYGLTAVAMGWCYVRLGPMAASPA